MHSSLVPRRFARGHEERTPLTSNNLHLTRLALLPERFPTRDYYPFDLPILQAGPEIALFSPVTFFVGENGTGKSTLLEALARRCGIHIWDPEQIDRVRQNPHEADLYRCLDVTWSDGPVDGSFFASQIFHHFTQLLETWAATSPAVRDYFGGKSLLTLSHGQSLMACFASRFKLKGLYLLDEPETALSPHTQLALLRLLHDTTQTGLAQFVVATHSPILLACPKATIYSFDAERIRPITYEQTQYFRLYRDFLANPPAFLAE